MPVLRCLIVLSTLSMLALFGAPARAQDGKIAIEKFNHSEWTKGIFSEAVTVTGIGNAKMIFLAGVGAEDENGPRGNIRNPGDFAAQCHYAYDKIKRLLEKQGATMGDIVKMTTYLTDMRNQADYGKCRVEAFGNNALPAHTLVNISQLAWPGMMVEIDATAVVPLK